MPRKKLKDITTNIASTTEDAVVFLGFAYKMYKKNNPSSEESPEEKKGSVIEKAKVELPEISAQEAAKIKSLLNTHKPALPNRKKGNKTAAKPQKNKETITFKEPATVLGYIIVKSVLDYNNLWTRKKRLGSFARLLLKVQAINPTTSFAHLLELQHLVDFLKEKDEHWDPSSGNTILLSNIIFFCAQIMDFELPDKLTFDKIINDYIGDFKVALLRALENAKTDLKQQQDEMVKRQQELAGMHKNTLISTDQIALFTNEAAAKKFSQHKEVFLLQSKPEGTHKYSLYWFDKLKRKVRLPLTIDLIRWLDQVNENFNFVIDNTAITISAKKPAANSDIDIVKNQLYRLITYCAEIFCPVRSAIYLFAEPELNEAIKMAKESKESQVYYLKQILPRQIDTNYQLKILDDNEIATQKDILYLKAPLANNDKPLATSPKQQLHKSKTPEKLPFINYQVLQDIPCSFILTADGSNLGEVVGNKFNLAIIYTLTDHLFFYMPKSASRPNGLSREIPSDKFKRHQILTQLKIGLNPKLGVNQKHRILIEKLSQEQSGLILDILNSEKQLRFELMPPENKELVRNVIYIRFAPQMLHYIIKEENDKLQKGTIGFNELNKDATWTPAENALEEITDVLTAFFTRKGFAKEPFKFPIAEFSGSLSPAELPTGIWETLWQSLQNKQLPADTKNILASILAVTSLLTRNHTRSTPAEWQLSWLNDKGVAHQVTLSPKMQQILELYLHENNVLKVNNDDNPQAFPTVPPTSHPSAYKFTLELTEHYKELLQKIRILHNPDVCSDERLNSSFVIENGFNIYFWPRTPQVHEPQFQFMGNAFIINAAALYFFEAAANKLIPCPPLSTKQQMDLTAHFQLDRITENKPFRLGNTCLSDSDLKIIHQSTGFTAPPNREKLFWLNNNGSKEIINLPLPSFANEHALRIALRHITMEEKQIAQERKDKLEFLLRKRMVSQCTISPTFTYNPDKKTEYAPSSVIFNCQNNLWNIYYINENQIAEELQKEDYPELFACTESWLATKTKLTTEQQHQLRPHLPRRETGKLPYAFISDFVFIKGHKYDYKPVSLVFTVKNDNWQIYYINVVGHAKQLIGSDYQALLDTLSTLPKQITELSTRQRNILAQVLPTTIAMDIPDEHKDILNACLKDHLAGKKKAPIINTENTRQAENEQRLNKESTEEFMQKRAVLGNFLKGKMSAGFFPGGKQPASSEPVSSDLKNIGQIVP